MRINSIINSIQQNKMTEPEKEKDKEKLRPIMSYYIINNHIYPNNYNFHPNPKLYSNKKKNNLNIANFNNLNININTNTNTKPHRLIKNNSTLSSYNPLPNNKMSIKKTLNPKLSKENTKKDLNSGNKSKRHKKKINLDSSLLLLKKISKKHHLKSTNDIFSNNNSFNLNTEFRKKNKKTAMTTLNSSKNSSTEKLMINSKKKFNLNNINNTNNNKAATREKDLTNKIFNNNNKIQVTNSSKYNNTNNNVTNIKLRKKNSAKLINNKLYYQNNKKPGFDIFMNYIKGANNINNLISNNNSSKSIPNTINNVSYNMQKIKINISELKNEFISKEIKNNLNSKDSSIKINKYNQSKQNKTARALSFKNKNRKSKINLNKLHLDLYTNRTKKKIGNKSKKDLKQYLEKYQLDSPHNKVFQKTSGNYFPTNNNTNLNLKDKNLKTSYKNKFPKKKNLDINVINNENHHVNRIDNNNKNIENIYSTKINKILKDGMKEINKIKNDFVKHFTTNNSPNKNNKDNLKEKKHKKIPKLNMLKNNDSNNILANHKKKVIKKNLTGTSNFKVKTNTKKNNMESKTQRVKQLTQNNSKIDINKIAIPKIKTTKIDLKKISPTENNNTGSISNTSRSIVHDSFYYLKESKKLSEYIKNYYKENKKYPETDLNFYKYGRLIGQGAFGKVNLGLNVLTGRVVAIKSFNKSNLNSNSENMKKIIYETNLMKKLNHPNITKILELFEEKEYILIIMEYINGGNLFSFLKKHRKVSEKTAKLLYKQIILGIKYMHEKNIVHRDIKLENILIDLNNNIKICDFGIGRVLSSPEQPLFDQCGTPMYIAPEILLCSKEEGYKGFPVDIWSSGIVLYILLSGTLPFSFKNSSLSLDESESHINEDNNNSIELQYSIINKDPKEIENISEEAKDLLNKLLIKNPDDRITIEEILNHPWMKDVSNKVLDSNKYHLFTKAEINILSKTYVDYRKDKNEKLKESFTISNLFIDEKNNSGLKQDKNEETKSSILAPFNSVINSKEDEDFFYDETIMDDFNNNRIKLENDLIKVGSKVKEFNMLYELNNNCEVDNGIIINSRSNTISSKSGNNSLHINNDIKDNQGFIIKDKDDDNENNNKNKNKEIKTSKKNEKDIEKILSQMEELGYDKKYVKECVENNTLCHASAAYFLMLNYDNI